MRREICGECGSPISDDGACDCTELLKRGWRQCAVGQKTTQWCAMAETLLREQRQRTRDRLRALGVKLPGNTSLNNAAAAIGESHE